MFSFQQLEVTHGVTDIHLKPMASPADRDVHPPRSGDVSQRASLVEMQRIGGAMRGSHQDGSQLPNQLEVYGYYKYIIFIGFF